MMALEVIREIVGFGESLVGRLVMLDARAMRFETLRYGWDPANPLSGAADDPAICRRTSCAEPLFAPRRHDGRAFEHRPFVVAGAGDRKAIGAGIFPRGAEAVFRQFPGAFALAAAAAPAGARVILPSAVNVILNLTLELVAAVNGWPVKNVDWMASGASLLPVARQGRRDENQRAAPPRKPAICACIAIPRSS